VSGKGVDLQEASAFQVQVFDNTDHEQRRPEEWVPEKVPEGASAPPALVAFGVGTGEVVWTPCTVSAFDEASNTFRCSPTDGSPAEWLHRIFVHFEAEDPFVYATRVAEAVEQRREVESFLRFNFFIDSMPTEDIPPLMQEQVNRMLGYALNSKKLKDKLMDTSQLIHEINIEYARTMNKIVFVSLLEQADKAHDLVIPMSETFPSKPQKPVSPTYHLAPLPPLRHMMLHGVLNQRLHRERRHRALPRRLPSLHPVTQPAREPRPLNLQIVRHHL
jgi:dynein heavy chain